MSNYTGARDVYSAMSEACRGSLETQYIMYKVGLRCSDDNLGRGFGICSFVAKAVSFRMLGQYLQGLLKRCNDSLCLCFRGSEDRPKGTGTFCYTASA